jgi:putative protease
MSVMLRRSDIEVMAPAGNFESLMAAVQGGADAVYFGVGKLNMRAKSSVNFLEDDLYEIVRICSASNVKTYLTLNTVLYDEDLDGMRRLMDTAKMARVSAVIVSDQAAMEYARKVGLNVHLSTQLNISNSHSLRFYSQWADVVVLARELNLQQVKFIFESVHKNEIKGPSGKEVRLELFVHGALCMAISGKCYLSLHQQNFSANRGECLQICRRSYTVTDKETGSQLEIDNEYIMSPKDLCTISFLDQILDAGVRVLKIEGRARGPEYVKTVTSCYVEAVEAIVAGQFTPDKVEGWTKRLSSVFNRGFWDGYYLGRKLGEWSNSYGNIATERKQYVGKINNYFSDLGVAELNVEASELHLNDKILIIGPTTGVIETLVSEIRVDNQQASSAPKGLPCSIPVPSRVRRSDKLYRIIYTNH